MTKNICLNGTMVNTNSYSSPVPLIGLYITAASLVCFILIICDVWAGIRRRKSWLPCRFFSLNSITLTLIAIAAKIPIDLTTEMPSAQDQLSKLSGTVFICTTMGFMMPSIGINGEFEAYANITALTIFVISVIVNICIQMSTGVVFCFIVEHCIILICMLLLLVRFWHSVLSVNVYKEVYSDKTKDLIKEGEESMLQRLKVCYLHGYDSCPQFYLCKDLFLGNVSLVCATCSLVLLEAVFRSLVVKDLHFCGGVSDYEWSVWLMVVTQILTVVVVSSTIVFRWLTYATYFPELVNQLDQELVYEPYLQFLRLFSLINLRKSLEVSFRFVIYYSFLVFDGALALFSIRTVIIRYNFTWMAELEDDRTLERFEALLGMHGVRVQRWVLKKGVEDMERWMERNKQDSPKHLIKLLSTTIPRSEESLTTFLAGNQLSSLTILLLVEMAKLLTPTSLNASLTNVLGEVFEIIHFIDTNVNVGSSRNRLRSTYAKVIWKFGLIREIVDKGTVEKCMNAMVQSQFESDHALAVLREFQGSFSDNITKNEARDIVSFIGCRSYASSKELYDHMEQVFINMLHAFLVRLPNAIFNHILESPIEEYEDRVRLGLGFVSKFEWIESHMTLSFPSGSNITSLIQISEINTLVDGNIAATPLAP